MQNSKSKKIFFSFPVYASFVRNDEALLKQYFRVQSNFFDQRKNRVIISFFQQFFHLLFTGWQYDVYVSFFAGYSSFFPAVFAKIFRKPHIIILGGTDCSNFPSIKYGNFYKKTLGRFTCASLKMATHLAPVAETLVDTEYTYIDERFKRQGYKNFCTAKAPFTTIYLGYDEKKFYCSQEKIPNSFLTVAQMNRANFYRKGIDLIFEVAPDFPDSVFTIVGHDPAMKFDSVPTNVQLLPFVPYEQLRDYYSRHEFYFQLSIMEGFPSAPCEAMLCECIPITSNVGALPVIVGDAGFLLLRKNKDELISVLREAIQSDKTILRKKARQRIIEKFPMSVRLQLVDLINQL